MSAQRRRAALGLGLLLVGCGGDEVGFAVQQGYLTAGEAPEGYFVWTFFPDAWERRLDPELLACARVQRVVGAPIDPQRIEGCPACEVAFELELVETEHDCRGKEGTRDDLGGPLLVAFGPLHPSVKATAPFPGQSLGWYVSWDAKAWVPAGSAFDEALLAGDPPEAEAAWVDGARYTLWPSDALKL